MPANYASKGRNGSQAGSAGELEYRLLRWGPDYVNLGEEGYEHQHRTWRLAGIEAIAKDLGYQMMSLAEARAEHGWKDRNRSSARE